MADKENQNRDGVNMSRRDFLKLAGVGAAAYAAAAIPAKAEAENPYNVKAAGIKGKADLLILGNVITMDEYKPYAEAVAVKGDKILYVGEADIARKLCDAHTKIKDYGKNSVYPGFLEAHCHPGAGGYTMTGKVKVDTFAGVESWLKDLKKYIAEHPEKTDIAGEGFSTNGPLPTAAMLDEICSDKCVVVESFDKHSMWLNTKAMKEYGINKDAVKKWGTDCVHVDANGNPNGIISEAPTFYVRSQIKISLEEMKKALLAWQDYALSNGYTGTYNAGVDLLSKNEPVAYYELEAEGKLKHYNYSGWYVEDNSDTPEADMDKIAAEAEKHNSKHYHLIGAKVFCDGVVEAHTAWLIDDYNDKPGYKGVQRFADHKKMVRLVKAASDRDMNVHIHSIGDASTKAWLDAIAEVEEATGNFDMRNALAHLHVVRKEDYKRIADYNVMAVVGMMWIEGDNSVFEQEIEYIGKERAYNDYPMKSLIDSGAVIGSHSDYPVSPYFSVPHSVCYGAIGYLPSHGIKALRHQNECISRRDTLRALTINVAYMWHEENRMGSLETGKLANITIFDKDFMKDDFKDIEKAKCLATYVDGELVYNA